MIWLGKNRKKIGSILVSMFVLCRPRINSLMVLIFSCFEISKETHEIVASWIFKLFVVNLNGLGVRVLLFFFFGCMISISAIHKLFPNLEFEALF